jgi:hypothetical protein
MSLADVGIWASATLTIFHNAITAIFHRYETSLGPLSRFMGLVFGAGGHFMSTSVEKAVRDSPVCFVDISEESGASKPTYCQPRVVFLCSKAIYHTPSWLSAFGTPDPPLRRRG